MSATIGARMVVCVTGASGYIASWLVKLLLQRGYTVKASVRDPSDPKKTEHLLALNGAKERLQLFKANLLEEGSFDPIVEGCAGVFHTASPCYFDAKDPQIELLDPAVKGTLNVLKSCSKTPSVQRVVLTSSMAAVLFNGRPCTPDVVVDESWFSNADLCRQTNMWYVLSKTLAEDAAWKFVKEKGIDMVTINPAMVICPLLQPTLNASVAEIANMINGNLAVTMEGVQITELFCVSNAPIMYDCIDKLLSALTNKEGAPTYPNSSWGWVNVKDVANAHILAFEVPSASGRYCLVERVVHYSEIVRILRELYPSVHLPEKCADDKPFEPIHQVSKEKVKSLGIDYIPLEQSLKETVESVKEKGFVKF